MIAPDCSYDVVVTGAMLMESQSGTPGIEVRFTCDEGIIRKVLWLTEKNAKYVRRDLLTLGLTDEQINSPVHLEQIESLLSGAEVSIETGSETYKDKSRVVVRWIRHRKQGVGKTLTERVASLLSGGKVAVTDDDVPF